MIYSALRNGISWSKRHFGLTLLLFSVNLAVAALLTVPFYRELMTDIGYSRSGGLLLEGFRYDWLAEFRYAHTGFFDAMEALIPPAGIAWLFLWSVLSGGILEVFIRGEEKGWGRSFSRGLVEHAFPFLRLALVASTLYLLTYWFLMIEFREKVERWIENSPYPQLEFSIDVGLPLLTIFLVLFLDMIFDYARIRRVRYRSPSILLSTIGSVRFCRANLRGTVLLYGSLLALSGIAAALYFVLYPLIPQNRMGGILFLFFVQEVWMIVRTFLRVATYACQAEYFRLAEGE
jgi:hypothetical protein